MADMIRAWVWQPSGALESRQLPRPTPGVGEALVKVRTTAVCGTDLHILAGRLSPPRPPAVIGHEASVEVVALGPGAARVAIGDRCALDTVVGCGACQTCLAGDKHYCPRTAEIGFGLPGIWQEYAAVPAANLYPVADTLSDAAVTQAEILHTILGGLERVLPRPGERAVVLGDGPGLLFLQALRAAGVAPVALTGAYPFRLDLARRLGAEPAVDTRIHDVVQKLGGEHGFDIVVDAVGIPATHALVTRLARRADASCCSGCRTSRRAWTCWTPSCAGSRSTARPTRRASGRASRP